ncbi:MAG: heme lyase CcmF/NrfE family subunit [Acidobacteria bacterium]|nr:heme lyase CcmF/NrfE family subunit [Acidobacteriota bacterium]
MENLGYLAVLLAFLVSSYAIVAALVGKLARKPFLEASAQRAVLTAWALTSAAAFVLLYAILTNDFTSSYVASYSSINQPLIYKLAAWWGGQEGSLLFWSWIAATYAFVSVYTSRKRHASMISYVIAIEMTVVGFFLGIVHFQANPFKVLMAGPQITAISDGNGLNPLLQHPIMAIHPPMLYLGYVGFMVPFAFAIASLITRQPGDRWIHTTRLWTMVTWMFQSIGILLGMRWAYAVLGWGGYWGWDPVENASLLPWITGTAFLHSVMMQEKKGMMKVWNVVLVSATFFLCIFGTMLTRSGLVSSVHAFAQSNIGDYFVWFLTISIAATTYLILSRLEFLKSEARLDAVLSRESSFLFNNVILLASCFAILWGTLFPVISEAVSGEKISVGAPFFNRVNIPIGLLLLLLTGVGPLFAWRKTSAESLRRNFLWPAVSGLVLGGLLFALGVHDLYALVTFMLCLFVGVTIVVEFFRGAKILQRKQQMAFAPAMVELTHRNTRRYGGYLVHLGIVLMFVGFAGAAFNQMGQAEMTVGDALEVGKYQFLMKDLKEDRGATWVASRAYFDVIKDGETIGQMDPEQRVYTTGREPQPTGIPDIRPRLNEDVYLVFAGFTRDGKNPIIQAYINPLVNWVFIGGWLLVLGTLVALVPSKVRRSYPKTRIVGSVAAQRKEAKPVVAQS